MTEEKANNKETLENALRLVREAIQKEEKRLRSIAEREEQHPVVVEGILWTYKAWRTALRSSEIVRNRQCRVFCVSRMLAG